VEQLSSEARKSALSRFESGESQVVVNVAVLTEGWDYPPTSCVILLRPSSYKSTLIQMIGRGLRTIDPNEHPGVVYPFAPKHDHIRSILLPPQAPSLHSRGTLSEVLHHDLHVHPNLHLALMNREGWCWYRSRVPIDLLKRSSFRWCDLFGDDAALMATGFEAWAGVFFLAGHWFGMGGGKKLPARLLAMGERTVCLAAAKTIWIQPTETARRFLADITSVIHIKRPPFLQLF
jgi:hypothetical protein